MDGGDTICADLLDGDDVLYLHLCGDVFILVLSMDVEK